MAISSSHLLGIIQLQSNLIPLFWNRWGTAHSLAKAFASASQLCCASLKLGATTNSPHVSKLTRPGRWFAHSLNWVTTPEYRTIDRRFRNFEFLKLPRLWGPKIDNKKLCGMKSILSCSALRIFSKQGVLSRSFRSAPSSHCAHHKFCGNVSLIKERKAQHNRFSVITSLAFE